MHVIIIASIVIALQLGAVAIFIGLIIMDRRVGRE